MTSLREYYDMENLRAAEDLKWWESVLPPGWRIIGWTFRDTALIEPMDGKGSVNLNGQFMADLFKWKFKND